jgi:toxin ParE1/3/4
MKRLSFTPLARQDLDAIHDYIATDSPAAAGRWIDRLEAECGKLAAMPGMGRPREEFGAGLRSFAVGSYLIFYREYPDRLEIVRVLHGARDIESLFGE